MQQDERIDLAQRIAAIVQRAWLTGRVECRQRGAFTPYDPRPDIEAAVLGVLPLDGSDPQPSPVDPALEPE